MQISNGAGGPVSNAGVDARNRLLTYATTREEELSSVYDGRSYSSFVSVTPSVGANIFFMIGSNTSIYPLIVDKIRISCTSDEQIDLIVGTYNTPIVSGSTGTSPVNKNVFTSKSCPWTVSIGTDMATASTLVEIDSIALLADQTYTFETSILLKPGYCLALRTVSGNKAVRGSVQYYTLEGTQMGAWSE